MPEPLRILPAAHGLHRPHVVHELLVRISELQVNRRAHSTSSIGGEPRMRKTGRLRIGLRGLRMSFTPFTEGNE